MHQTKNRIYGIIAAILAGLFSFLAHQTVIFGFHFPDLSFLIWISWVPLLVYGAYFSFFKERFLLCFLALMISQYGLLFWLITAMKQFGGLNFLTSFLSLTLLNIILILPSLLAFLCVFYFFEKKKIPLCILFPIFFTLKDWLLHIFPFGGYPWGIAPYSQAHHLNYFQWVSQTGVFGLSFFIYLINGLFSDALINWIYFKKINRKLVFCIGSIVFLFIISSAASFIILENFQTKSISKGKIKLGLIQANITQDMKWSRAKAHEILKRHVHLQKQLIKNGAELILWPETSYPFGLHLSELSQIHFLNQSSFEVPLFVGAFVTDIKTRQQYNQVLYINKSAQVEKTYSKIHLVPFGEYLPFRKILGFLENLTQGIGYFNAGSEYTLFKVNTINFGSLICIEDVFPQYAKNFTKVGADVLVNYTNDAWYGDSSAQHQHVAYSQFRALENRRPVVRVTNTGKTAIINALGEVINELPPFKSGFMLYELNVVTD